MSVRLEMIQAAHRATKVLGDAAELVRSFFRRQQNPDGGFRDRTGKSDLYYTVFGLDALRALEMPLDARRLAAYLGGFGGGEGLDLVHLCCLARAWAATAHAGLSAVGTAPTGKWVAPGLREEILRRLETHRSQDGGYHPQPGQPLGTAYGCFLALGAYQDLHSEPSESWRLAQCVASLQTEAGAFTNEPRAPVTVAGPKTAYGLTTVTAAAATLLRQLHYPVPRVVGDWLLARCQPAGGFLGLPGTPIPDLLSTATALHALAGLERDLTALREPCLDFLDSLWTNEGAFHGQWSDDHLDCEYTFYGLLALGHLSG